MKTVVNSMEKIEAVYCFTVCDIQQLLNAFHRTYGQTTTTHWGHLYTKHLTRQILTSLTGIIHTPRASSWAQENPTYRRLMPQVDIGTSPCKICLRVKVIRISQNRNIVGFFLIRKADINMSILFFKFVEGCSFILHLQMSDPTSMSNYGAPAVIYIKYTGNVVSKQTSSNVDYAYFMKN